MDKGRHAIKGVNQLARRSWCPVLSTEDEKVSLPTKEQVSALMSQLGRKGGKIGGKREDLKPCLPKNASRTPAPPQKLGGLDAPKTLTSPIVNVVASATNRHGYSMRKKKRDFARTIRALEKRRKSPYFLCSAHGERSTHFQAEMDPNLSHRDHFAGVETLEILIHSPGGHADKAYRLARYLAKPLPAFERLNTHVSEKRRDSIVSKC